MPLEPVELTVVETEIPVVALSVELAFCNVETDAVGDASVAPSLKSIPVCVCECPGSVTVDEAV